MASIFGNALKVSVWGESHGESIGVVIDGLPSGCKVDTARVQEYCDRRRSRGEVYATPRKEADILEVQSGLLNGYTTGAPLTVMVRNGNVKSRDYDNLISVPRPSHADYPAEVKYGGYNDKRGGGHFSGRITLPLVIAGGIAREILEPYGIRFNAYVSEIGGIKNRSYLDNETDEENLFAIVNSIENYGVTDAMLKRIEEVRSVKDSVGGVIECVSRYMPVGIGEPIYDCVESSLSKVIFGIPSVKGLEFGLGFGFANKTGSVANDSYYIKDGAVRTRSNNNGGIVGGLTNGMPIAFRVAVKPTASIARIQQSVDLSSMTDTELKIGGRHDACIVPRAVVVVESAAYAVMLDEILLNNGRKFFIR